LLPGQILTSYGFLLIAPGARDVDGCFRISPV
jgi:hypothetical protein